MSGNTRIQAIGQPLARVDGTLKVTGAARYTAEWNVPNLTYGAIVSSRIACGTVQAIDGSAAMQLPGVLAIITHLNAPRLYPIPEKLGAVQLTGEGGMSETRQPLQDAEVHYAGQVVAVVVADSPERARHAARVVRVTYQKRPPELIPETARRLTRPDTFVGNPEETLQVSLGDPAAALATAPVRITAVYESVINHHHPIEHLATIAQWEERDGADFLTLHDTSRTIKGTQEVVAKSFGLPPERVHVICPFIGGSFGSKGWTFFNPLLVAAVAKAIKRAVKMEWTRQQMVSLAGQRAATKQTFSLGATQAGKLLALQQDTLTHTSMVSGFTEPTCRMTRMMYDVPNLGFSHRLAHLNLPSATTMRGPGDLVGSWAMECALDELATELHLDPVALRLLNYAETNPETGKPWSGKRLRACYERGRELIGWEARNPQPRSMRTNGKLVGYGMASTMYASARGKSAATATVFPDGRAVVRSATQEIGNGAYTIFRQIGADALALPVDRVQFELGDSDFPFAPPTGSSSSTASVGPAVLTAGRNALATLKQMAGLDPQSPLFGVAEASIDARNGQLFGPANPTEGEAYGAIIRRAGLTFLVATGEAEPGHERADFSYYSFGAVFAEVQVDACTGFVSVARLCGVYDVGRLMNARTAHAQLMGGMLMSAGATLMEETLFDPRSGRPVVRSLADYHIMSCADTPVMTIECLNIPDPHMGELGGRGLGEMGCVGTAAAITNAVFHATGQRLRKLPLTPDKLIASL